ncbi:MAG: HAMP domain-containing histidine kinase [Gammaproteobacteria bacterium]|nr:HAMP domain-containing histidine kinase [Gammaproteobacteria bacterium]
MSLRPLPHSAALNLYRLFWLRIVAIIGQTLAVGVVHSGLRMTLPIAELLTTIGVLIFLNGLTWARLQFAGERFPVADGELFAQLLVDVGALSVLLYFSGGATNPFIMLFLLPLTIAAATLPVRYTWALTALSIAAYSLLQFYYRPIPDFMHEHNGQDMHLLGMWFAFVIIACLMAHYVARMAETLRERQRRLSAAREDSLRNEQIVGLATLAAGAAHELGTPLSTIAVVAGELEHDLRGHEAALPTGLLDDVRLLKGQIEQCRQILRKLSAAAGDARAEGGRGVPLDKALLQIIEEWRLVRPRAQADYQLLGRGPAPRVVLDATFAQAVQNILNNAADVSPLDIAVRAQYDPRELSIEVADRGPGLTAEMLARAGQPFVSTKKGKGFGIGIFLANATLERYGGKVSFENREGGGAQVTIRLPLSAVQVME